MSKTSVRFSPSMKEVRARYKKAMRKVRDFKTLFTKAAIYLDRWTQQNFKTQGGKVGGWKPLKAGGRWKGKGKRRRLDTSAQILQDKGRLRASFLPFADSEKAVVGSDLPYAQTHHEGMGVPKRQITPEKSDVIEDLVRLADNHAKTELRKAKLL